MSRYCSDAFKMVGLSRTFLSASLVVGGGSRFTSFAVPHGGSGCVIADGVEIQ